MPFFEGTYRSGSSDFPYSAWWASGEERARVYVLHGMGSAPSEFAGLGEFLSAKGISVVAPALRGQGLDPDLRRRGTELKIAETLVDLEALLEVTPTTSPRFLCGESMGALLAVQTLSRLEMATNFKGAILLCPVWELRQKTPDWIVALVHLVAKIVPGAALHPGLFIHGKARAPKLTEDTEYQKYLGSAPFRLPQVCLGFLSGMEKLMTHSRQAGTKVTAPVLLLIGGKDPYISVEQSQAWFETVATADKHRRIFAASYHLLLHDTETAAVMTEILDWIEARRETSLFVRS